MTSAACRCSHPSIPGPCLRSLPAGRCVLRRMPGSRRRFGSSGSQRWPPPTRRKPLRRTRNKENVHALGRAFRASAPAREGVTMSLLPQLDSASYIGDGWAIAGPFQVVSGPSEDVMDVMRAAFAAVAGQPLRDPVRRLALRTPRRRPRPRRARLGRRCVAHSLRRVRRGPPRRVVRLAGEASAGGDGPPAPEPSGPARRRRLPREGSS